MDQKEKQQKGKTRVKSNRYFEKVGWSKKQADYQRQIGKQNLEYS